VASAREELHFSLRREARNLLEEASTVTEQGKRRSLLLRAFSLVQQAETYRNVLSDDYPAPDASQPAPERNALRQEQRAGRPVARLVVKHDLPGEGSLQGGSKRLSA
jgi:hypothetical protein